MMTVIFRRHFKQEKPTSNKILQLHLTTATLLLADRCFMDTLTATYCSTKRSQQRCWKSLTTWSVVTMNCSSLGSVQTVLLTPIHNVESASNQLDQLYTVNSNLQVTVPVPKSLQIKTIIIIIINIFKPHLKSFLFTDSFSKFCQWSSTSCIVAPYKSSFMNVLLVLITVSTKRRPSCN